MNRIYVVEDDENIREMLRYALNSSGFEAEGFADGAAFFEALRNSRPGLVLLDIMLPGDDGIALLKKLRGNSDTKKLPVIMLTAKGAEYDRIKGLDSGADDYVCKPFSVLEVISRIRAVLRRASSENGEGSNTLSVGTLSVGALSINMEKRSVTAAFPEMHVVDNLTYKEFEVLHCLMLNPGMVFSRDKLLNRVWGQEFYGDTRTVDMHIKTLRQKLGLCGAQIKTVRNVGYKIEETQ